MVNAGRFRFRPWYLILVCLLGAPFAARSQQITVNTICELNCASSSITSPNSISGNFNFDYTVAADSDEYNISGSYEASYSSVNGSTILVAPVVSYMGSTATAAPDTITFDFTPSYFDSRTGSWAGTYEESGKLILTAPGSATAQLLYDNDSVGLVTQTGPGTNTFSQSKSLDFGMTDDDADTLFADYQFVFNFAAGTTNGQGGSAPSISATPEPVMIVPCGLCLVLLFYCVRRSRVPAEKL